MKHLFVHYELALLAKEKGFDEECLAYWDETFNFWLGGSGFSGDKTLIFAPLYQQLVDWFREKHLIAIEPLTWVEKTTWMVRNRQTNETLKTFVESDYYLGFNSVLTEAFKLI